MVFKWVVSQVGGTDITVNVPPAVRGRLPLRAPEAGASRRRSTVGSYSTFWPSKYSFRNGPRRRSHIGQEVACGDDAWQIGECHDISAFLTWRKNGRIGALVAPLPTGTLRESKIRPPGHLQGHHWLSTPCLRMNSRFSWCSRSSGVMLFMGHPSLFLLKSRASRPRRGVTSS